VSSSYPPVSGSLSAARFLAVTGCCIILFVLVVLIAPWIGTSGISLRNVLAGVYPDREIFLIARLPRVLFGAITGGALAIAGVLFQAVLRNSLACPFTLGVSSGSSFGAAVTIWLGLNIVLFGIPVITLAAFAGALLTIVLVFFIARSGSGLPTFTLLLAGVTLNFVFAALILFIYYAANFQQSYTMVRWMMGSLGDATDTASVVRTIPFVLGALVLLLAVSPKLNALAAGEEWAASRGVDVERLKKVSYFAGSILTGAVTAFSGPIGFVGLIVPHTLRMIVGPDHRLLIPSSFFVGGAFLVTCDTFARTILSPTEIPVGVVTALLGGPFFIFLLRRRQVGLW
jgi:iron complex transport system permease protein